MENGEIQNSVVQNTVMESCRSLGFAGAVRSVRPHWSLRHGVDRSYVLHDHLIRQEGA